MHGNMNVKEPTIWTQNSPKRRRKHYQLSTSFQQTYEDSYIFMWEYVPSSSEIPSSELHLFPGFSTSSTAIKYETPCYSWSSLLIDIICRLMSFDSFLDYLTTLPSAEVEM